MKALLIIILSLAFVGQVVAQAPYVPIRANNFWTIETSVRLCITCGYTIYTNIATTKDTILPGRTGVYLKYKEYNYDPVNQVINPSPVRIEYFRNDSINRRVYYIFDMASTKDSLYYDFNAIHVGDPTLPSFFTSNRRGVLLGFNSVVIRGKVHRIHNLDLGRSAIERQIEGIGHESGLIPYFFGPDTPYHSLTCFNSNTINNSLSGSIICDSAAAVILKLQTLAKSSNEAIIASPNPQLVDQEFQLTYRKLSLQEQLSDLKVYDVLGKDVAGSFSVTPSGGIVMHESGVFYIRHPRVAGVTRIVAL